ncbi:hypothetical protein [Isoptericola sp. NPDC056134]|uniref:hypothetical protein n=1 Tax=Isoptericola sp. NPDC056134 TaxID=3345723 RepID=UPI0035E5BF45
MSSMQFRTTVVVSADGVVTFRHEPHDEQTVERVRALHQPCSALLRDEPEPTPREPPGVQVPEAVLGMPAKEAAHYVRGPSRPNRGVAAQTARRYIREGMLLALRSAENGYLVPLSQLDPSGLPPARLQDILDLVGDDVRHEAATIVWFLSAEVGRNRETPVQLLRRNAADDISRVAAAISRRWPRPS